YEAPDFRLLRDLRAVRERRVYALAWAPDNCARRLEYPIDMLIMAKGVYPERFRDIRVHQWVLGFYQRLYGADGETAEMLRSRQWLDWMVRTTF
ncbi:MAG: iron ABC transporter substrate-binding protein, partial [Acidobacteria bacterium]|nr:iron ABC transporter substrate-binding protein [Acidobacteriota bacterium]